VSAFNIVAAKAALHAWVVRGSGLPPERAIYALGQRPPEAPYLHIRFRVDPVGHDWIRNAPADDPQPGLDTVYTVCGYRTLTVILTCFGADTNAGERAPEQILNDVVTARSLPSVVQALAAAGMGSFTFGSMSSPGATIQSSYFEPRSTIEARCQVVAELSELGPSIATADIAQVP
jgi:hypothetical protein